MNQNLTPEQLEELERQQQLAQQTGSQDTGVLQVLGEVTDIALDVLGDAASCTGDVICSVGGGIVDVAGSVLGALFD